MCIRMDEKVSRFWPELVLALHVQFGLVSYRIVVYQQLSLQNEGNTHLEGAPVLITCLW